MKNIFEKFRLVAGTLATVTLVAFSLQYSFSGYAYKNAENLHEEVWAQAACAYLEAVYNNLVQQVNINCIGGCSSNYTCMNLCSSRDAALQAWLNCQNSNQGGGDPGGGGNSSTGTGTGGGSSSGESWWFETITKTCTIQITCPDKTTITISFGFDECNTANSGNCTSSENCNEGSGTTNCK